MVVIVEVVEPTAAQAVSSDNTVVVEVVNTANSPVTTTNTGTAATEVVGHNLVQNAYVGTNPPSNPYEGQVWIDIT